MNVQDEIKALKERIAEVEEQIKREQSFPREDDEYWYANENGEVFRDEWGDFGYEKSMLTIGNVFQTENEAVFAVEKLRVEAELRKFSRPFKHGAKNHTINYNHETEMVVNVNATATYQETGSFYFDSYEEVVEAIESVGEDRIKKYIFGVEN